MGAGNVAVGVVRIEVQRTAATPLRDLMRDMLGLKVGMSELGKEEEKAAKGMDFLRQRALPGLKRDISSLRNNILLLVFTTGAAVKVFADTVKASVQFQVALAGVRSVALATGNSISGVTEATIELTKDGLLTLAGAAQGLKNLMATGLNLPQAINLMKVFKDAASFNRQGILEFEEAIVRATAGVKMQNARLIDDVGIRTRVGQMLERQGFAMEDLTNETTKAAAVQALYNGLMQEGRFFLGDAAKLTDTYAGAEARLEAQTLKTKAAFGDILTGVSSTSGAFGKANKEFTSFITTLQYWIVANRSALAVKIDVYFEKISSALKGAWTILGPVVGLIAKLADFLVSSGGAGLLLWLTIIDKLVGKFRYFQEVLASFAGEMATGNMVKGIYQLSAFGKNIEKVGALMGHLRTTAASTIDAFKVDPKKLNTMALSAHLKLLNSITTGKPYSGIVLQNLTIRADAVKNLEKVFTLMKNVNVGNLKQSLTEINRLLTGLGMRKEFAGYLDKLEKSIPVVQALGTNGSRAIGMMTIAWNAAAAAIGRAWIAAKAFWEANKYLIIFQVLMVGLIWLWDKLNQKQLLAKQIAEETAMAERELNQARKDIFDSRLAEVQSLTDLLEEYKNLDESLYKTQAQYKRMQDIQDRVNKVLSTNNTVLETGAGKMDFYSSAIDEVTMSIENMTQALITNRQAQLEMQKADALIKLGEAYKDLDKVQEQASKAEELGLQNVRDLFINLLELRTRYSESPSATARGSQTKTESTFMASTKSALEVGKDVAQVYRIIELNIKKVENAQLELSKVNKAGTEEFAKLSKEKSGLLYMRQSLRDLTDPIMQAEAALEDMNLQLKKLGDEKGPVALKEQFERFLETLKAESRKAGVIGGFADKFIELQERVAKFRLQLQAFGQQAKNKPELAELKEADALIDSIARKGIGRIAKEATQDIEKMSDEATILLTKFERGPEEARKLDLELRKANKRLEIANALESGHSSLIELQNRQRELRKKFDSQTMDRQKELTQRVMDENSLAISAVKDQIDKATKLLAVYEKLLNKEEERALLEIKIAQNMRRADFNTRVKQAGLSYESQEIALRGSKEEQEQTNLLVEHKNRLLDIQAEKAALLEDRKMVAHTLDMKELNLSIDKENFLNKEIKSQEILYNLAKEILTIQQKYNLTLEKADIRIKKATTRTGASGAALDILGGGSVLGGGEAVKGIMSGMAEKDAASTKFDAYKKLRDDHKITYAEFQRAERQYEDSAIASNERIMESFENLFGSIANLAMDTFDIFGLKAQEASEQLRAETRVDQLLLEDQFKNREITVQEYEAQRIMLAKKAGIEETRMAAVSAAEQKISIGNVLKSLAVEMQVRALAAFASGLFGDPQGFAAAAGYQAAAIAAGAAAVPLIRAGQAQRAQAEANARLQTTLAERQASRATAGGGTTAAETGGRSIGGTISAQELHIYISPTTTISGETIIISDIGIQEAQRILGDAVVERIQEAVENRELVLTPANMK